MRKALGRGLDALLPTDQTPGGTILEKTDGRRIPIESIKPNHLQPRKNFDPQRLSELSGSIKEHGLVEPIAVSFDAITNTYELIAGERRLRACKLAGLTEIEVVIRTPKSDKERLGMALVENIQRDDLNAIETAMAYKQLMTEFAIIQSELSKVVGKSKSAVSNTLRLLDLPDNIQKAIQFEEISEGHARALLMVSDGLERNKLFKMIMNRHLSVRNVEALAQQIAAGKSLNDTPGTNGSKTPTIKSADIRDLEKQLAHAFGTKVEISTRKDGKSGRISIHFYSLEDFDHILKTVKK